MFKKYIKTISILIVNDEVLQLMILQHMMTKIIGIPENQITSAINGIEAFEKSI